MWWMTVNTKPGAKARPRIGKQMGGGYKDGKHRRSGQAAQKPDDFGGGWDYNYDEVFYGEGARKIRRYTLQKSCGEQPDLGT